jgi:hypothetical protein
MRKLLNRKIAEQNRSCALCDTPFTNYDDIVPDHINPKGWEELGVTTIRRTSRQSIDGATVKKIMPL